MLVQALARERLLALEPVERVQGPEVRASVRLEPVLGPLELALEWARPPT